jgi:hypothetical protein
MDNTNKKKWIDHTLLDDIIKDLDETSTIDEHSISTDIPELTPIIKAKMMAKIDTYNKIKDKMTKINNIKSELNKMSKSTLRELETMMKIYCLDELIKGSTKFIIDKKWKKKTIKATDYAQIVQKICDTDMVDKINHDLNFIAQQSSEQVESIKCLKYKPKKNVLDNPSKTL